MLELIVTFLEHNMKEKLKLFWAKFKSFVALFCNELKDPFYHGMGGQLAFYLFMSILPIITLMSQFLSLFSLSLPAIQEWASISLTDYGLATLDELLSESMGGTIGGNIALILLAIWAASKAQFQLTNIADYINNDGKDNGLNYIRRRGRSYVLMIMMIITLCVALAFLVYLPTILNFLLGNGLIATYAGIFLSKIRWLIVLAFYFFVISIIYYVSPSERVKYKEVIPGSIFASIGFICVTLVYSVYLQFGNSRSIIYGSLANIVVLMMWFFFISWVICLGSVTNKLWKLACEVIMKAKK